MNVIGDKRDAKAEEALSNKMNSLIEDSGVSWGENSTVFWANKKKLTYPPLAFVDENLYLYELYKLYTERPQKVADRIIAIARELESV